jgi:hypothetical protein
VSPIETAMIMLKTGVVRSCIAIVALPVEYLTLQVQNKNKCWLDARVHRTRSGVFRTFHESNETPLAYS